MCADHNTGVNSVYGTTGVSELRESSFGERPNLRHRVQKRAHQGEERQKRGIIGAVETFKAMLDHLERMKNLNNVKW